MKKRILAALLATAMISTLCAGCGSKEEAPAAPEKEEAEAPAAEADGEYSKTLEVWLPPLDEDTVNNWGGILGDWEKEHDCKVNITLIPWQEYSSTWTTALNAGEGPDVGYMYNEMFPTFITAGAVADMSSYITDEDAAEYKYLKNGFMMEGQYGWPLVTGVPFVLYYNQDILDELGETAPETWDDFLRICKEATKDTDGDGTVDQYGYCAGLNTADSGNLQILNATYYDFLWQAGGQIYKDDLKSVDFNSEAGKEAMNFLVGLKDYMNPDFMSLNWTDAFTTVFAEGKAAFGVRRSAQTDEQTFSKEWPDLNWDFVTSLKNKDFGTFGATDCLTLMSAASDKDLAMDFIKYVTGAEFNTQYHAKCPGAVLTESEPYVGDAKMEKLYTVDKDKWHGLQVGPCGTEILTQLAADFQGIMSGEVSVEEGLKEAEDYANGLLDDYWATQG